MDRGDTGHGMVHAARDGRAVADQTTFTAPESGLPI